MPIIIKDFKLGLFPARKGKSPNQIILFDFLEKNKDKAYTIKELHKLIPKLNTNQIQCGLTGLKRKELILNKHYYWTYNPKKGSD